MSTTCSKYIPLAVQESQREQTETTDRGIAMGELRPTIDITKIRDSSIPLSSEYEFIEHRQTLKQADYPFRKADPVKRQKQQIQSQIKIHQLRQHAFNFGHDKPANEDEATTFMKSDYKPYDGTLYAQNKKQIKTIGGTDAKLNVFRSDRDIKEWREEGLVSEQQRQFHKKPVTDPFVLKQIRDDVKISNITQNFKYGYDQDAEVRQKSSYTRNFGTQHDIDPQQRAKQQDQVLKQKKVLSQSSILTGGDPKKKVFQHYNTSYQKNIGRANQHGALISPEMKQKNIQNQKSMKETILKTSVRLGSDQFPMRSEYKSTFRNVKFV